MTENIILIVRPLLLRVEIVKPKMVHSPQLISTTNFLVNVLHKSSLTQS